VLEIFVAICVFGVLGVLAYIARLVSRDQQATQRGEATRIIQEAQAEADSVRQHADDILATAQSTRDETETELHAQREDLKDQRIDIERREHRISEREERLDLESRRLEERARELAEDRRAIDEGRAELADLQEERLRVLAETAGLPVAEARAELLKHVEDKARLEAMAITRDIEREAQEQGESRAQQIVVDAIQRVASEQTTESVVSVLHLPSDDMKGRIIGREGRNIRAFEQASGVNVIIDDTPEAVLLSCFDPIRREVARLALEALVKDGRIHPQRIEDQLERSKEQVHEVCTRAAEDAILEVGLTDIHPELVELLGRLKFRTSYGQNVLRHVVESAHLAGLMAGELGLDVALVKRCAFLHDIGKALTHEVEGSHALVGAEVARRHGENGDVVHAIEAHHNEVEPKTVEAVLTQAADAISGSRPGARRESLEAYVTRVRRLEELSLAHDGVKKVFAMQAGREVRVMVEPDQVDDLGAAALAREIAQQVEEELTYPGQVRVTVIRESRASEVAK
jgi:ribonuclease Y